jgi:hypothetical protein
MKSEPVCRDPQGSVPLRVAANRFRDHRFVGRSGSGGMMTRVGISRAGLSLVVDCGIGGIRHRDGRHLGVHLLRDDRQLRRGDRVGRLRIPGLRQLGRWQQHVRLRDWHRLRRRGRRWHRLTDHHPGRNAGRTPAGVVFPPPPLRLEMPVGGAGDDRRPAFNRPVARVTGAAAQGGQAATAADRPALAGHARHAGRCDAEVGELRGGSPGGSANDHPRRTHAGAESMTDHDGVLSVGGRLWAAKTVSPATPNASAAGMGAYHPGPPLAGLKCYRPPARPAEPL